MRAKEDERETERRRGKSLHMEPCNDSQGINFERERLLSLVLRTLPTNLLASEDLRRVLARRCAVIDSSSAERECVGDTLVSDLYGNRFQVAFHNNRIWTAIALQSIHGFWKELSSEESNHPTKSQNNHFRKPHQTPPNIKLVNYHLKGCNVAVCGLGVSFS
ncbi:hypothetical protein KOW79_022640 [Hemibagrus wyckioides]|uniref:Uncharacterized protein n=1 Tax=Hemibagrus wyckioides TaxID=337641 RepID=A0A9D3N3H8_9TELE|nr:hypothetical protein KOW79_022640 [Hemibagrus wyckioides]